MVIEALVAATDLYVWKLLHLDPRRDAGTTQATVARLVHAIVEAPCTPS